ncbi:MAG TPA: Sec-independent protein translocase subunit TatA [Mycobacteriales bacterium]
MGAMRPWHVFVLVAVLLLLFGAKRLPDAARSLGRSMRIFKAETRGLLEEDVRGKAEAQAHRAPEDRDAQDGVRDDRPAPPSPEPLHDDRR